MVFGLITEDSFMKKSNLAKFIKPFADEYQIFGKHNPTQGISYLLTAVSFFI